MKKQIKYILITLTTLLFTACGGGEGSANFTGTTVDIDIVLCSSTTIANYTKLQSGDAIVKDDPNTIINTYHDIDGNKLICVSSGAAHITR